MDVFSTALSGMQAAERRVAASAHNVANLNTDGFRPLRVVTREAVDGGTTTATRRESKEENVDLAREVVDQRLAGVQYQASLRVIGVASRLTGELVDLFA